MIRLTIPKQDRHILEQCGFELANEEPIGKSSVSSTVYLGKCNQYAQRQVEDGTIEILNGRYCAIKVTLARRESEAPIEARVLEQIKHPGVLEVYLNLKSSSHAINLEEWIPGRPYTTTYAQRYFVMEYMNAGTLSERLRPLKPDIPEREAISMFQQLTAGLQYLHENNIVHKDLHAGNIMINCDQFNNFQYKIVDFGSAEEVPDESERETVHEQQLKKDMSMLASYFTMILSKSTFEDTNVKTNLRNLWDDVQSWVYHNMGEVFVKMNEILSGDNGAKEKGETVHDNFGWADFVVAAEDSQEDDDDWGEFVGGGASADIDDEWGEFVGAQGSTNNEEEWGEFVGGEGNVDNDEEWGEFVTG